MKRDVKVGLLVAAVVCGLAAVLLGGGLVGREPGVTPALAVAHDEAPPPGEDADVAGPESAARDSSEEIAPPPEEEPATLADEPDGPDSDGRDGRLDGGLDGGLDNGPDPISSDPATNAPDADPASAPQALPAVAASERDGSATESSAAPSEPEAELDEPGVAVETLPTIGPDLLDEPSTPVEPLPQLSIAERPEPSMASLSAATPRQEEFAAARVTGKRLYVVKRGESFFTITKKLFGTVRYFPEVQKANPDVDPRRLRPGQVIAIPAVARVTLREEHLATPEDMKPKPAKVYLEQDATHLIRPGETLEGISKRYYNRRQKWRHILRANLGRIGSPKRLRPGIRIVIPALTE